MASSAVKDLPPAPAQLAEDESRKLKKNTDCVYFLASPSTCIKGSECDYRHSEYAGVNPKDCWYWLNGNCLNPKCLFRHPPIDTLLGTPSTPYVAAKPAALCVFFQKGGCLKGDSIPF